MMAPSGLGALSGLPALVRLNLRRDRVMLPIWLASTAALAAIGPRSAQTLLPTQADYDAFAATAQGNAAFTVMLGQPLQVNTPGGFISYRVGIFLAVLVCFMNITVVNRHTRADEEAGRTELTRSGVVGRNAPLTAALGVALLADLVVLLVVPAVLIANGLPTVGSIALGVSSAVAGLVFAGIASVAAQLNAFARGAYGLSAALIGVSYLVRGVGDSAAPALSWFSPLGWFKAVRPFAGERWWVLLVSLAFAAAMVWLGYLLAGRRDLGAGALQPRAGRLSAAPSLSSSFALAVRLQRGTFVGWLVGMLVLGVTYGSVAKSVTDLFDENPALRRYLEIAGGGDPVQAFIAAAALIMALIGSGFALQTSLRAHGEEGAGRVEPLLGAAVSKVGWLGSYVIIAVVGTIVMLVAAGFGFGLVHGIRSGDLGQVGVVIAAMLVYAPAVWVLIGAALMLVGLWPAGTPAVWGLLAACLVLTFFGSALDLPQWLIDLSPFAHVPGLPSAEMAWPPLLWLTLIAAALIGVGLVGFRRRDLQTP
ncbi:exporter of polyketide antibiotics [Microlunatus panaciterrae]|uniref:ABC-2 type transport system permease protein n=1 Tax=Microlunatus panaciterrae TaxID=400768 RepID=A0ABS2RKH2_9ACTN|nr:ABC transporter permease [Microlunatus panaciterrae]MBM7799487.1 ABC-2 type transport system permease protein [Microlunatus panaciterrae]